MLDTRCKREERCFISHEKAQKAQKNIDADFADFADLLATNEHEISHIYIYHEGTKKS